MRASSSSSSKGHTLGAAAGALRALPVSLVGVSVCVFCAAVYGATRPFNNTSPDAQVHACGAMVVALWLARGIHASGLPGWADRVALADLVLVAPAVVFNQHLAPSYMGALDEYTITRSVGCLAAGGLVDAARLLLPLAAARRRRGVCPCIAFVLGLPRDVDAYAVAQRAIVAAMLPHAALLLVAVAIVACAAQRVAGRACAAGALLACIAPGRAQWAVRLARRYANAAAGAAVARACRVPALCAVVEAPAPYEWIHVIAALVVAAAVAAPGLAADDKRTANGPPT